MKFTKSLFKGCFLFSEKKDPIKPFSRFVFPKTPLSFKEKQTVPIHINKDSLNSGIRLTRLFLTDSLPFFCYYGITFFFGPVFDLHLLHNLTLLGLLGFPVYRCDKYIKENDFVVKELHIDKNGRDLIAIIDKSVKTGFKPQKNEKINEDFKPELRHSKNWILVIRFQYSEITGCQKEKDGKKILLTINSGKHGSLNLKIDLNNHLETISQEYLDILISQGKISTS